MNIRAESVENREIDLIDFLAFLRRRIVYAFYGCSSLKSIVIPEGVTNIGDGAFYGCSGLKSVMISEGVTRIENSAFYNCSSLMSILIPESVTSIGSSAFSGCSGLKSVVIAEGVTRIGDAAFSGCTSLKSLIISEGVTSIGSAAFSDCIGLTSITLPEGVTSIGNAAFSGCSSLTSVVLPKGVTSISEGLFMGCSNLRSVVIPDSVTSIETSAFSSCKYLTSITVPQSVETIASYAMRECKLVFLMGKEKLTSIGSGAFASSAVVYCWEYYYAEARAKELGYKVKLLDELMGEDGSLDLSGAERKISLESSCKLQVGEEKTLKWNAFPEAGSGECEWSSSAPEIVSVDKNGRITALDNGYARITLKIGQESVSCDVNVRTPLKDFTLSASELQLEAKGTVVLSIATKDPIKGDDSFSWSIDNSTCVSIQSIQQDCATIYGKSIGTAVITVQSSTGIVRTCRITVTYPASSAAFEEASM